ncbi:MAG: pirin family protein [Planctomycetes bacterium]|nr:pirin family protein [Planctomycetota bacterium]
MINVRPSNERGHFDHGWLDTFHSFSFGDYYDPQHVMFRALRVMNEDRVAPGQGFGMHGHRDMEIVTYVLSGELQHRDSLGNGAVIQPGELQRMTAGSGIRHSEFNPSATEPVHLYQVWLLPRQPGLTPSYDQRVFDPAGRQGQMQLVVSPAGERESLIIQQDARIYLANLTAGQSLAQPIAEGRHGWLQVLRGKLQLSGHTLAAGDGAALSDEAQLELQANEPTEVMWFDLP